MKDYCTSLLFGITERSSRSAITTCSCKAMPGLSPTIYGLVMPELAICRLAMPELIIQINAYRLTILIRVYNLTMQISTNKHYSGTDCIAIHHTKHLVQNFSVLMERAKIAAFLKQASLINLLIQRGRYHAE